MTSKSKKGLYLQCEKCQSALAERNAQLHERNCPPFENWDHSFIHDQTLYSTIEVFQSQASLNNISEREANDMVFISQSALQLCDTAIGDSVIVTTNSNLVVKTVWPINDKSLTSVCLTKQAIELNNLTGLVKVYPLKSNIYIAKEIIISQMGKRVMPHVPIELDVIIKNLNEHKIFIIGNKISIPYYGKKITYKIVQIKTDEEERIQLMNKDLSKSFQKINLTIDPTTVSFYKALFTTKWTILNTVDKNADDTLKRKYKIEDIGGYNSLICDIKDAVNIGIGKYKNIEHLNINKGIILYGPTGVGKSIIANAIISEYNINNFIVHSSDIYSKVIGETESKLKEVFNKAISNTPSIILLEDIDTLCPNKSNSSTDHERRVLAQLITFFDHLQNMSSNLLVMATTSKLDSVDTSLRRPGRLDIEFEVYVPTPNMRTDILKKLLSKIPNTLSDSDIESISFITHGFVGADLYGLCSKAITNSVKREQNNTMFIVEPKITINDFNQALITTKPSAMKEVLIEVPNVKWSDIGGQKDIKLKLKQAVEWPLKHPEAFTRMGITPPKGVLMYGPPGCSKTMIAKALATESKVNFLNIKGPELFSKWVGDSEKAVREMFRKARQVAPSIIFIDEIDALGSVRGSSSNSSSGSNVQERVLAQLLIELDGVTALGGVTLVGATNRPDKIDRALLRPGRLDRILYVGLPDEETRREIFHIKLRNMPIAKEINIEDLVYLTEGYTGAEIQAICHEAALKALEEDLNAVIVKQRHFKAALSAVTPRTPVSLIKLYEDYMSKVL